MVQARLRQALESAANLAAVGICVALLVPVAHRYLLPVFDHDPKTGLQVGVVFPKLPGVSYGEHRLTLALFVRTHCLACEESMPDYEMLRQVVQDGKGAFLVCGIVVGESINAITEAGFHLPVIQVKDFRTYNVSGTPTIVLIDPNGRVIDFWVGRLSRIAMTNLVRLMKEK
jgi:hypothetical protein